MPPALHSILGASSAHRWSRCPGSIRAMQRFRERHPNFQETSPAAEEGTRAHELAESLLRAYLVDGGEADISAVDDQEMLRHAREYRDYCLSHVLRPDNSVAIEQMVTMPRIHEDCFGTADFVTYDPISRHLQVIDLKYGEGVAVHAQGNQQLIMYAEGARQHLINEGHKRLPDQYTLHIYQPRARLGGGITQWHIEQQDLNDAVAILHRAALRTLSHPDTYNPGPKQCRWCVKADCQAHVNWVAELSELEDVEPYHLSVQIKQNTISDEELGVYLKRFEQIVPLYYRMKDLAAHRMMEGSTIPGRKLVPGQARYVADEDMVQFILGDEALRPTSVVSRTELIKRMGRPRFDALVGGCYRKVQGSPTLVPLSDKRVQMAKAVSIDELLPDLD